MARSGTLRVRIIGDDGPLKKTLGGASSKMAKFGAAAVAAGATAAAAMAKTVSAASDLEQSIGAVESVFGESASVITKFGQTAAASFGLSRREVNETAAVLGASLQSMGFEADDAAGQVVSLQERAADLAATFGGRTSDALEAMGSLLRGERDPIEKFGVSLKQADINARIMALGLDTSTTELKKQAEATAALDLLMQQSASSAGAFAREQDTLAGRTAALRARFENFQASIGEKIIPLILAAWDKLDAWWARYGPAITAALTAVKDKVLELGRAFMDWWNANVRPVLTAVWDAIKANGDRIRGIFSDIGDGLARLGEAFAFAFGGMSTDSEEGASDIERAVSAVITIFEIMAKIFKGTAVAVSNVIEWQTRLFNGFQDVATTVGEGVGNAFRTIGDWAARTRDIVSGAFTGMVASVRSAVNSVIGFVNRLINGWNGLNLTLSLPNIPDWVPGIGGRGGGSVSATTPNLANLPMLANGGTALRPGMAIVGEKGPELAYMNRGATIQPLDRGGMTVHVHVAGSVRADRDLAETIHEELLRLKRGTTGLGLA